jgi:tRNA threonylcarbamoyladenosine biosynthesis protein TsaE
MEYDISTIDLLKQFLKNLFLKIPPDACFTLSGHPGAGKTTLVKTAAEILKIKENVQSPTFNILNIYSGYYLDESPLEVYHFDFYRLSADDQLFDLQIPDHNSRKKTYIFMEWPEKVNIKNILPDIDVYALTIETKYSPETSEITERKLMANF